MVSRIPPASPASIMLVVRSSKILGYCRMALDSVEPPSTVVRTPVRHFWKNRFSWLAARISRHCTSGSPASIMTENWRKKTAMSLMGTLPVPSLGRANSLPFSLMAPGVMRSRRNCMVMAALLSPNRSPEIRFPWASVPVNVNTGISTTPLVLVAYQQRESALFLSPQRSGRCLGRNHSTVNNVLQFVRHGRALQRCFQRDLLLEIERGKRLVKGLHSKPVLAGLHGGINLVNFVFTNQVAHGGVGNKDLHGHHATISSHARQQRLAENAFQNERELSANLRLLVRGKNVNDTVDGGSRRVGVQRSEGKVTCFCNAQRRFYCLKVAHFADEHHVWIFTQRGAQSVSE